MRRPVIRVAGPLVLAAAIAVLAAASLATDPFAQSAPAAVPQAPASAAAAAPASPTASWTDAQVESFLLKARVVSTRPAGKGVTTRCARRSDRWNGSPGSYTWWIDDVMMDEEERLEKNLDRVR